MKIKMYRIKESQFKYRIVCDQCHIKGFIDSECHSCGGKGIRNKTINVWNICKNKEIINRIDREDNKVSEQRDLRYWTSSDEFYREQSKLLHFSYNDAKNECNFRNKNIQHILDNQKLFEMNRSDCIYDIEEANLFNEKIWTTQSGTRIRVADMSNEHIQNTINFLKREDRCFEWIDIFLNELEERSFK